MVAASAAGSSAAASARIVPPGPPVRQVARPVVNLGSTCYMNAVLQALAHAPELCLAMDCDPHHVTCPIALENRKRRLSASPTSSPEEQQQTENDFRRHNSNRMPLSRKLRRSSRKSPNTTQDDHNTDNSNDGDQHPKYCALCEMEWHLQEVHSQKDKDKPVAPSFFVHGFIDHVAPWFKLGQQEDSHEFLRLLIDAMQRSCKNARREDAMEEDIPPIGDDGSNDAISFVADSKDVEYPFQLFRGTVDSCVTCDSCGASSSTLDPIEDVGLEVHSSPPASTRGSSPNTSEALADVNSAFQRFARVEALDQGYKCEKCGKRGATKQSRLASIPPILTLHLKRFRYGADGRPSPAPNNSRRAHKNSGSAKIEGHIKFEQIFNLKPYLTDKLQQKQKALFCRLFAVIVHAGKNSHSGHYVAYVRNVSSNEWWKMDDARVTQASLDEVMNAEAYMLFYRVLDHPFAVQLEERAKKMRDDREEILARLAAEAKAEEEAKKAKTAEPSPAETEKENLPAAENKKPVESPSAKVSDAKAKPDAAPSSKPASNSASSKTTPPPPPTTSSSVASGSNNNSRKRGLPTYTDGKSWAKANTRLKSSQYSSLRRAEEYINENVQFKPDFFKRINEEGSKANAKVDQCPIKRITGEDVVGGYSKFSLGLKKTLHRIAQRYEEENGESLFAAAVGQSDAGAKSNLLDKFVAVGGAPAVQDDLL